jgi:AcrR family transcriptional regulator
VHDQDTAQELLRAAEAIAADEGPDGVTVRHVADAAGVSVRAVYSLYGSKDGLLIALGRRAFEMLGEGVRALPETEDPAADLVAAGELVFRRFAVEHPSLFRIGVQSYGVAPEIVERFAPAAEAALVHLRARVTRALGREVPAATLQFHALCEGLAAVELGCMLPAEEAEQVWHDGLTALVTGLRAHHSQ